MEIRELTSTISLNDHLDWPHVGQVCSIYRERRQGETSSSETAYFVTSLSREQADAPKLLALARRHWGAIENGVHYVRDVTLGEDQSTICSKNAPQNLAAIRNAGLNLLRGLGIDNIASTIRSFTRQPQRLFKILGILK